MNSKSSTAQVTSFSVIHARKKKPKILKSTTRDVVFLLMDLLGQVEHQVVLLIELTNIARNIWIVGFFWNINQVFDSNINWKFKNYSGVKISQLKPSWSLCQIRPTMISEFRYRDYKPHEVSSLSGKSTFLMLFYKIFRTQNEWHANGPVLYSSSR